MKGFKKALLSNVKALVDTPTDLDVQLEVGSVNETVNITSGSEAPLNTTDATLGNTFERRTGVASQHAAAVVGTGAATNRAQSRSHASDGRLA